jgi:hypothetical protein
LSARNATEKRHTPKARPDAFDAQRVRHGRSARSPARPGLARVASSSWRKSDASDFRWGARQIDDVKRHFISAG